MSCTVDRFQLFLLLFSCLRFSIIRFCIAKCGNNSVYDRNNWNKIYKVRLEQKYRIVIYTGKILNVLLDEFVNAFVAAFISASWILCPFPVAKRSSRKYTATTYIRVFVGPLLSITLSNCDQWQKHVNGKLLCGNGNWIRHYLLVDWNIGLPASGRSQC